MSTYKPSSSPTTNEFKSESTQSLLLHDDDLCLPPPSHAKTRSSPTITITINRYLLSTIILAITCTFSVLSIYLSMMIGELKGIQGGNLDSHTQTSSTPPSLSSLDQTYQKLHTYTNFSSPDDAISNAAWDQYVINGFVAIPHTWALDRGWPIGRDMPGDSEKGIYVVDGFHQLHCLMSIRSEIDSLLSGTPVTNLTHTKRHLNHCYDALRQAIICRADPTPLYVPRETFFAGDGQERQCGSWERLQEWVVGHSICYNGVGCEG